MVVPKKGKKNIQTFRECNVILVMFLALPLVAAVGRPRGGGRGRADRRVRAGAGLDEGHSVGGVLQVAGQQVQLGHL